MGPPLNPLAIFWDVKARERLALIPGSGLGPYDVAVKEAIPRHRRHDVAAYLHRFGFGLYGLYDCYYHEQNRSS